MRLDLSRAHRRFLGLTAHGESPRPEELVSIGQVEITPLARASLEAQLGAPGRYRGGALLGYRENGAIVVLHATSSGYTCWHEQEHGPLDLDERYLLGWLDGLRDKADPPSSVDWVGNWLSYPDSHLGDRLENDVEWINQASQTRLIDAEHCLLIVGWEDGALGTRAYTREGGGITPLHHNLAGLGARQTET